MTSTVILSDNGASSGSAGLKSQAGNDGTLLLQTTTSGGTATTAMTLGTDQSVTFAQAANLPNTFGFKNRIINGAMMIDQRNAGASVTLTSANDVYPVDRLGAYASTDGTMTAQQSSTAPTGFVKSVVCTTTVADASLGASQRCTIFQRIEGYNVADFGFGAVGAATITLSFWVRSSLTGTFGAAIVGASYGRSYPFSYTISAANTWEQKTVTISGDTSGTWLTTNGVGLVVVFSLGVGSNFIGTANTWQNGEYYSPSGATSVIGTSGATFYITGVQLEKGSTATSFDFRDYGRELVLCQRYYCQAKTGTYPGSVQAIAFSTSGLSCSASFPVTMRSTPTVVYSQGGTTNQFINVNTAGTVSQTPNQNWWSTTGISGVTGTSTVFTAGLSYGFDYTASAEL